MWWTIGGWAVAALGAAVVVWALFWDRARGRLRCLRCWYALDETPTGGDGVVTCPECGKAHATRRKMLKTRRRWGRLWIAGVLFVAAYGVRVTPRVQAQGWVGLVPTTALVVIAPMEEEDWAANQWSGMVHYKPRGELGDELMRRLDEREPWGWQWRIASWRTVRAVEGGAAQLMFAREKWPVGVPIAVDPRNRTYGSSYFPIAWGDDVRFRARVRGDGGDWVGFMGLTWFALPHDHGVGEVAEIECEVSVERGGREVVVWSGVSRRVEIVEHAHQAIELLEHGRADHSVLRWLKPHIGVRGGHLLLIHSAASSHLGPWFDGETIDWGLKFRADVYDGDLLIGSGAVDFHMPGPTTMLNLMSSYHVHDLAWTDRQPEINQHEETWTLRLTDEPALAINELKRDVFWKGELEVPVTFREDVIDERVYRALEHHPTLSHLRGW